MPTNQHSELTHSLGFSMTCCGGCYDRQGLNKFARQNKRRRNYLKRNKACRAAPPGVLSLHYRCEGEQLPDAWRGRCWGSGGQDHGDACSWPKRFEVQADFRCKQICGDMWALPQTGFPGRVILYSEMPGHAWAIRCGESRRVAGVRGGVHCKGLDARMPRAGMRLRSCCGSRDGGSPATWKNGTVRHNREQQETTGN